MSWREPAPEEREAGERSWEVVREAFEARIPSPRPRDRRPLALVAVAAAVLAAAFTPPGHAVLGSLRDVVRGEENAKPALVSLPSSRTRLLVNSAEGAWVVQSDGSKRLLAGYRDGSWSPHGLYLAAVHGDELRALEPDGDVHWSVGRLNARLPRWSNFGSGNERIVYFAGRTLRVVGGDGRGDRVLAHRPRFVVPAWRPKTHVIAYADAEGPVIVADTDRRSILERVPTKPPRALAWSDDGRRLLIVTRTSADVFDARGRAITSTPLRGTPGAAAFAPSSHRVVVATRRPGRSEVLLMQSDRTQARVLFAGAGEFGSLAWSPDGKWLLLGWDSADQWLFLRSAAVRKLRAVSGIEEAFGPNTQIAGWCCP
jgi:WD40-like Beta Propeller Repeat